MTAAPESMELPLEGTSAVRVLGGVAVAVAGAALSIGAPPFCVYAVERALASTVAGTGAADVRFQAMQATAQRWMLASNVLAGIGVFLVVASVLVLALTPGLEHPAAPRTRAYGVWGARLAVALIGSTVLWLSYASRVIAANDVIQEVAARAPHAPPVGLTGVAQDELVLWVLLALAYLAASARFVSIARGLRLGAREAIPRASKWALQALALVLFDAIASVVLWLSTGESIVPGAVRLVVLAPWPLLIWAKACGWKTRMLREDPENA